MFIFLALYFGFLRKLEKTNIKHTTENSLHFHAVKGEPAYAEFF